MFITLIVVMGPQVYAYVQTYQITLITCSFFLYQLYFNKAVRKKKKMCFKQKQAFIYKSIAT